jgi:hypothetical protein
MPHYAFFTHRPDGTRRLVGGVFARDRRAATRTAECRTVLRPGESLDVVAATNRRDRLLVCSMQEVWEAKYAAFRQVLDAVMAGTVLPKPDLPKTDAKQDVTQPGPATKKPRSDV